MDLDLKTLTRTRSGGRERGTPGASRDGMKTETAGTPMRWAASTCVLVGVLLMPFAALGCTTSQPSPTVTEPQRGCALGVAGATVVADDTTDGVALSFTSKDKLDELRDRAKDAAAQHGPGQGLGLGHNGRHGDSGEHGLRMMDVSPTRSVATDIPGGSQIRFASINPTDIAELRTKLRDRVSAMNALTCK